MSQAEKSTTTSCQFRKQLFVDFVCPFFLDIDLHIYNFTCLFYIIVSWYNVSWQTPTAHLSSTSTKTFFPETIQKHFFPKQIQQKFVQMRFFLSHSLSLSLSFKLSLSLSQFYSLSLSFSLTLTVIPFSNLEQQGSSSNNESSNEED